MNNFLTKHFVFKNPTFNYKDTSFDTKTIIFINKEKDINKIENYIPCLFIQVYEQCSNFLIFFKRKFRRYFYFRIIWSIFIRIFKNECNIC